MKLLKNIALSALCVLAIASCANNGGAQDPKLEGITNADKDTVSYALGTYFGYMLKGSGLKDVNYGTIMRAMKACVAKPDSLLKMTYEESGMRIQGYMTKVEEATKKYKENEEKKFFEKNAKADSVQQTESGLQYKIIEAGSEVRPTEQDTVVVNYKGELLDGTVFDSSYDRGEPATFQLRNVIKGWTEGIQLIGVGGKATLWIPFSLGYANRNMGPKLPAYSTLKFDVELVEVKPYIEPKPVKTK